MDGTKAGTAATGALAVYERTAEPSIHTPTDSPESTQLTQSDWYTRVHPSGKNPSSNTNTMKITSKGQVTIPQPLRMKFGLLPNTEVTFEEADGCVLIRPILRLITPEEPS